MQTNTLLKAKPQPASTMRAIIEIVDGELKIFPVADSDIDAKGIFDALRFMINDQSQR